MLSYSFKLTAYVMVMFLLWFTLQCTLYIHNKWYTGCIMCLFSLTHSRFNVPPPPPPSQEISATMPRSRPPPPPSRVNPPTRSAAPPPPNRSHPPPPPMSRGGGSSSDSKCFFQPSLLSFYTLFSSRQGTSRIVLDSVIVYHLLTSGYLGRRFIQANQEMQVPVSLHEY